MRRRVPTRFILEAVVFALCVTPAVADADVASPSAVEAQSAIQKIRSTLGVPGVVAVSKVGSCYPSNKVKEAIVVCLVEATVQGKTSTQPIPFSKASGTWKAIPDTVGEISARCPDDGEAQALIRKVKGISDITVHGETDDGAGSFTDERGMSRDKKGPLRLMCRYTVSDALGKDRLYISYVGVEHGKYFIDPDIEIWD